MSFVKCVAVWYFAITPVLLAGIVLTPHGSYLGRPLIEIAPLWLGMLFAWSVILCPPIALWLATNRFSWEKKP